MKAIKKVEVVPLEYNEGKIIDSASSTDDKTKNTYSMRIVDQKISNVDSNVSDLQNNAIVKGDFVVLMGTVTLVDGAATTTMSYPTGFTNANSVVLSVGMQISTTTSPNRYSYGYGTKSIFYNNGLIDRRVSLDDEHITLQLNNNVQSGVGTNSYHYKIVLMKIDPDVSSYELGDINMDGVVNNDDITLLQGYLTGSISLTDKQFKLADMNNDGILDSADILLLQQKIGS